MEKPAQPINDTIEGCVNVYVANLPQTADAKLIRAMFAGVGKILHVKLLLDIATGTSRGIAFVMFEDFTTAKKACALKNRTMCDGNVLQVRLAERSSQHQSPDSHARSRVVYIRNVPFSISSEMMKAYCENHFGPVEEVTPHPQSAEGGGPSPYNMLFVQFKNIDDASVATEEMDGKTPFPIPTGHPLTMAKMITDVAGEMRKSILLRRRSSESPTTTPPTNVSPKNAAPVQMPFVTYGNAPQGHVMMNNGQLQGTQRRLSSASTDSLGNVQVMLNTTPQPTDLKRRGSDTSSNGEPVQMGVMPQTTLLPMVYQTNELPGQHPMMMQAQPQYILVHPGPQMMQPLVNAMPMPMPMPMPMQQPHTQQNQQHQAPPPQYSKAPQQFQFPQM